jgi:NitT/TauT family transport system substrate-binding protein
MKTRLAVAAVLAMLAHPATAADTLKLAIGQRGLWDSSFAEIGMQFGLFQKHGLELQVFYTSGGGETQQAVISGSADIGVSPGTLGVLGAFAKGSGTHITALRFLKDYGFQAKLVATGNVPATFTSVMSGQVDIGFSTPPFGLDALAEGKSRLIALANDLPSVRNQTVRLIIANANDLAKRREVYDRFIKAYREVIDWMYSDPRAFEAYAKYASITPATAQKVRDEFYPKSMLQLDEVKGMPELMQDAIAFKYIPAALTEKQLDELLQLPKK